MLNKTLSAKRIKLEQAWSLIEAGRLRDSQRILKSMTPEMQNSEGYHTMWLSTLIFGSEWREVELYARKLVDQHGDYYLSAWHALVNGLAGQGKYAEAQHVLERATSNWPQDEVLQAIGTQLRVLSSIMNRN